MVPEHLKWALLETLMDFGLKNSPGKGELRKLH